MQKNFTFTGILVLVDVRIYTVLYRGFQNWHRIHLTA